MARRRRPGISADVVAFDVDGTLTHPLARDVYQDLSARPDVRVGVVSARNEDDIRAFLVQHGLSADFTRGGHLKGRLLRSIETPHDAVYVGNRVTDWVFARTAGWGFRFASSIQGDKSIESCGCGTPGRG